MITSASNPHPASAQDTLGCPLDQLDGNSSFSGSGIKFYKKSSSVTSLGRVATPSTNRGFLIGISAEDGHERHILKGKNSTTHKFDRDCLYVRDFAEPYKADITGSFDFMLLEVSHAALAQISECTDMAPMSGLANAMQTPDPVLGGLARALFCAVSQSQETSALFIDHMSIAIGTHLALQYGSARTKNYAQGRKLSRLHEMQVKDIIRNRMAEDISVEDLASACSMSSGVFLRAFRETTGKTPFRWLMQQRIERARDLLVTSNMTLSQISSLCGFADQSHFTRVFATSVGTTPGLWRRGQQT